LLLRYHYLAAGYTTHGVKIPEIPIIYLALRIGKYIARGPAIIDTGFDGGIYPNVELIKLLRGIKPVEVVEFETPFYGASEFEVYEVNAYLYYKYRYVDLGKAKIYVPTHPELLIDEVIIGREILNKLKITLNPHYKLVEVEFTQ